MKSKYTKVLSSYVQGPRGSGWGLSLLDQDGDGIGVKVNYHKLGWPTQTIFKEEMSIHDLKRLKSFVETAINALSSNLISTDKATYRGGDDV